MSVSKRLREIAAKRGTHEWFLGLDDGQKKDYLTKHPTSCFTKPMREAKAAGKKRAAKGVQTRKLNQVQDALDNRVPTATAVSRLQQLKSSMPRKNKAG